jgi:SAM-dependent methyltransferase
MMLLLSDLPRGGPGSDACTLEALRRLPPLPPHPIVLDLGCGPGRQSLVLARTLNAPIIAVDLHRPFLDQLEQGAKADGLSHLVEVRCEDMGALDIRHGSVDLIWSEGAAYALGFEKALDYWRTLLVPQGLMAVTECSWLADDPPEEALTFWRENYPAMGTVSENRLRAEALGLEVLGSFPLPPSAWWTDYYSPLLLRMDRLRATADADLLAAIHETEREIDQFRRHGDVYGYVFYLFREGPRPSLRE